MLCGFLVTSLLQGVAPVFRQFIRARWVDSATGEDVLAESEFAIWKEHQKMR